MIYGWHISVVVIFYSFCEVLLLNYLDFFFIYINLGKNYSNLFFSIILCIFVTALFSGYTDYFSLCEIFFFVFVCEYNHNFVSKTYFYELQLMKSLFTSLVKYCVSKVSAYKKKIISWCIKKFNICLLQIWKTNQWGTGITYNFGHFTLVWNRSTFVFLCLWS